MRTLGATALVVLVATVSSSAAASPSSPLVRFEQTGGFAGIERGMTVQPSGRVVSDGLPITVSRLSPARLDLLRERLADARWGTLRARYDSSISDAYVYRITYAGRTIRIEEGATLPLRLARLDAMLERIAGLSD